jgi:hypothetical protein
MFVFHVLLLVKIVVYLKRDAINDAVVYLDSLCFHVIDKVMNSTKRGMSNQPRGEKKGQSDTEAFTCPF